MRGCKECGQPVFGGGFCKYHQFKRRMQGGDLYERKPPKPKKKPKPVSNKLEEQREYYKIQAQRFFDKAIENKTNDCIFCGEKVNLYQGLHHWKGRVGKYLTDSAWWSVVHNDCHLQYHRSTVQQMTEAWGQGFWVRLAKQFPSLLDKIKGREQKLNPTLWDDENF